MSNQAINEIVINHRDNCTYNHTSIRFLLRICNANHTYIIEY